MFRLIDIEINHNFMLKIWENLDLCVNPSQKSPDDGQGVFVIEETET